MKIFLVGKTGSLNHWLEDAAGAFRAEDHQVGLGVVRRPWLNAGVEAAVAEPLAAAMARAVARFSPELILAMGAFHVPAPFLQRLAALPGRPPLAGWVGDMFDDTARVAANVYDLIAYTDSGLLARHAELGFPSKAVFLPHGVDPAQTPKLAERTRQMVFVANATPGRRAVVEAMASPIAIYGPGWPGDVSGGHHIHRRVARRAVAGLYARHLASLNIRNEVNVLTGLNQRNFDPGLSATPVVSDAQADLELCFDPGTEVLVWRDAGELDDAHDRLLRSPGEAAMIGEAGRRRVLAEHTFAHRLAALRAAL